MNLKQTNEKIRNICKGQNLGYKELARICGGDKSNYSFWLNGSDFQFKKLNKVAEKIGLKIELKIKK